MSLSDLPKLELAHLPTALEPMTRLASAVGTTHRLFVKRDDCTGLGMGGNKARKLEYVMADALAKGVDTVLTCGGTQSNHVRMTAAASARLGLEFHCVLADPVAGAGYEAQQGYTSNGNCLLDAIFGGRIHHVEDDGPATESKLIALEEELRTAGKAPYVVPLGASSGIGAMGYVRAVEELLSQCDAGGIHPSHVVLGTGSAGTHAGLLAGLRAAGADSTTVVGISVSEPADIKREKVRAIMDEMTPYWSATPPHVPDADIIVSDRYIGDGYALPSDACIEAIRLTARTEGLLLDPVYTGKVMAGFLGLLEEGAFGGGRDIVFLHTGGAPAIFAYPEYFVTRGNDPDDAST